MNETVIGSIKALLQVTRRQLVLSGVISAGLAATIVTSLFLTSQYQGYGHNVFAEVPRGPLGGSPVFLAIRSISDGITFAWINHSVHYYPYAALFLAVLFLSPVRRFLSGITGKVAAASAGMGSLLGFGHFFLFSGNWQEGYWENPRFNAILLILTLPAMIYFSRALLLTLIFPEGDDSGNRHAEDRFRSHLVWIFAATGTLMMAFRLIQSLSFTVGDGPLAGILFPLLMAGVVFFLVDAYVRWLMKPGQAFLSMDFRFSTMALVFVVQMAAHTVRLTLMQDWLPETRAGQAIYWFVYFLFFALTSMYSVIIMANAGKREDGESGIEASERSIP